MTKITFSQRFDLLVKVKIIAFVIILMSFTGGAQTTTFSGTGNWSDPARWTNGVPDNTHNVFIAAGSDCTIDIDASAKSLTFAAGSSNSTVSISGTSTLAIEGELTYSIPSGTADQVMAVNNGSLICGSVFMPNSGSNNRNLMLTVNEGSVTVLGDVELQGSHDRNYITFTGAGTLNVSGDLNNSNHGRITANAANINVGGNMRVRVFSANSSTLNIAGEFLGAYTWGAGSTVNYTGGNQTIFNTTYYNLTISGGGINPLRGAAAIAAGGTIALSDGKLNLSGYDLTMETGAGFSGSFSNNAMLDFSNSGRLRYRSTTPEGWQRVFPIGTDNEYSPMVITGASGVTNTRMFIEVVSERHPLLAGSDNAITRYWKLNPDNTGLQLTGTFTYHDNDVQAPIAEANLTTVGRLSTTGWVKNDAGTGYDHGSNTISFDGAGNAINAIGIYTLGEDIGCFEGIPYRYTVNSGSWGTAGNWNGGTLPVAGDDIYLLHAISLDTPAAPGNLTVEVTGSLNLNSQNITVTGTTEVYGRITDSNNAGTNTFQGLVTIREGGQITSGNHSPFIFSGGLVNDGLLSFTGAGAFTFENDIVNNGQFSKTGAGAVTFRENDLEISGTEEITMNGAVTVSDITITNNGSIVFTNTAAMSGTGSWVQGEGSSLIIAGASVGFSSFNAEALYNTVIYGFAAAQTINTTTDYFNLIIRGQGTKTISGQLNVINDFAIRDNTTTLTVNAGINDINVGGEFVVFNTIGNASLNQSTGVFHADNIYITGPRAFTFISNSITTGNFEIDGNNTYTITSSNVTADNLIVKGGGTTNFSANANITNNFELESSSVFNIGPTAGIYQLSIGNDIITANGSTFGITVNGLHTITVNNNVMVNGIFDLFVNTSRNASLVFNTNVPHTIGGSPGTFRVYDLRLNPGSNTTTANIAMTIAGSVEIGSGATLDAGAHTHSVAMNWNNGGTLVSSGTFVFNGGTQILNAEPNFHNVSFITAGSKLFAGNIAMAGDLEITNATVVISNNDTPKAHLIGGNVTIHSGALETNNIDVVHDLLIGGNLNVNGRLRLFFNNNRYSNLSFINDIPRQIGGAPTQFDVFNLVLANSSNVTTLALDLSLASGFFLRNGLSIGSNASLITNGYDIDLYETIQISPEGTLQIDGNSVLTFRAPGKSIQNAGNLIIEGIVGNEAVLTASAIANRFFVANSAGSSLVMKHYNIDYLTGNGVSVLAGATADIPADNFSFGTFGPNSNSNQCLLLTGVDFDANNPVVVTNTEFNNTVGFNVSRTSGTGSIDFYDATGPRAGQSFENDNGNPGTLINWFYPSSTYFTIASGDFLDPAIWNTNPTGNFNNASSSFLIRDGHDVVLNGDIDVLELIVGEGASGSLTIGNSTDARTLTAREHLTVMAGAQVNAGSAAPHQFLIYGNLVNDGSMQLRSSSSNIVDVSFLGMNSKVNGENTINFNIVTFGSGSVTTAYQSMNIQRNVIIENNAVFDDGGFTHTVARNWTESGSGRRTGEGTIVFNGVVSTISSTDGSIVEFHNVICTGAGAADFTAIGIVFTTHIYGDLTVNDTKEVRLINDHMMVYGDFIIAPGARFLSTTSMVTFNGINNQNINLAGEVNFYDLTFSGASVKTISGNITTSRFFAIHSDATVEGAGSHEIGNTLTINGTCNFSGNITMRAGSITSSNTEIHLPNLSNLYIAGNVSLSTTSSLNVITTGNVEVVSHYLLINENTLLSNTGAGNFILGDALNLYVRATDGFPVGFAAYQLSESSSVRYDRDLPQIIRGGHDIVYGNLRIGNTQNANPQIRQADGHINMKGFLSFENVARHITFDLAGFDLTISGNILLANSSLVDMSAGGTLTLNAEDANQTLSAGTYILNNVVFTLDAPTATRTKAFSDGSDITILGNLTATCESAGTFINNITFHNNLVSGPANNLFMGTNTQLTTTAINVGANFFDIFTGNVNLINGTVHFANTTTTQFIPHSVTYGNITFTGTQIKEATGPLTIAGNVSVTANTPYFRAGGFTHTVAGNWLLGINNTRLSDMLPGDKIIFNGISQYMLPGNFMHLEIANTGTASISGGNITIHGNFTVRDDATFDAGVRNITIHGNWHIEPDGVFTQQANGFVNFVGQTNNQSIVSNQNSNFWNLHIEKNNGEDHQTVTVNSNINVRSNLTLAENAAIFDLNNYQLNLGRNLTINNNIHFPQNTFIAGTGSVILDGYDDVQYLQHYNNHDLVLHHLIFNSPTNKYVRTTGSASLSRNVILTGNWINNFENVYGYSVHHSSSYVNFFVQGDWINRGTFYHVNSGYVTFNGEDQQIGSSDFWNVVFANTGVKTLRSGNMTVKRDLAIEDGVTLDVGAGNYNILVAGNWDMSAEGAIFNAREGLVRFDGNGTIFTGMTGENPNKNFWNIDISASVTANGDLDVDNNFRILNGTFTTGTNKVFIGGDFLNNGTFNHTNNDHTQVIFNASSGPRSIDPGTGVNFRNVIIDAPGITYNVLNNFSVNSGFELFINAGTLNLNSNKVTLNNTATKVVINPLGEFIVNERAFVEFAGSNQSIQNQGGVLRIVGTPDFAATLTRVGGSYFINQTSGVFHAQHYRFEMIGAGANGGITISGGTIDVENNFSNGSFLSGTSSANITAYLDLNGLEIDNATNLVMINVIFNGGGSTNRNIRRDVPPAEPNDGIVFCQDCIGTLSGPSFEIDDGSADSGYVQWTYPSGFFWVGAVSDNWHENTNWDGGTAPTQPSHNVYFDPGTYIGTYNIAKIYENVSCGNVIILNNSEGLGFEVAEGIILTINGLLNIEPGGFAGLLSETSVIDIHSHWQNAGTFAHGNGTVRFLAPSSTINIVSGLTNEFYNLEINSSGNAIFALGNNTVIANNLNIINGTFDVLLRDISIGGSWYMEANIDADFNPRNRIVTFTGNDQVITNGKFNNLVLVGAGTKTLASNIVISGDLTIGEEAIFNGQNFDVFAGRNWTNNNLFLQTGTGTVVFNGGTQQVDNGSQVTRFNRVIFAGSGTKTFHQASEVWGDLTINNGSSVNFSTFTIDGGVVENTLRNNGYMFINGVNNFPENFESIIMASNSRVYYNYTAGDQIIKTNNDSWSYGDLYLGNNSGDLFRKIPEAGNLTITGSLVISHVDVILDMEANSTNMILTRNITLPAGGQQINWGIGTTKLTHVGGDWNISANIEGFNNLELGGTSGSWKRMYNDLIITGDVTIKNGIRLIMDPDNLINPKTMTCTQPGKTFTMESNSRLYCAITSDIGVAAPTGFENYFLADDTRFYLRSPNGTEQTIFTGNGIQYGNLYFQHTKNVTIDGIAALRVNGLFDTGTSTLEDNGSNIFVRRNAHIHEYTASPGSTFTFFGSDQVITNGSSAFPNPLNFQNVVFMGSGVKTLGNRSVVNIAGNMQITPNVRLTSGRDIYFTGGNWNCEGRFEHVSGRTVYFSAINDQFINPGPQHDLNIFRNIDFTGDNDVLFVQNGATINGNFIISGTATVNLGEQNHRITGNIENTMGGNIQSALADISFVGGTQNVNTPNFEINNVNVWGTGTKRMFSNWIVNGDIHITSTLNNLNTVSNIYHDIEARSNWFNTGSFTHNNQGLVTFNASADVDIDNGGSNFHNVTFGNDTGVIRIYNIVAETTSIRRAMQINQDAHVLLNGNTLNLGLNIAEGKNYLVRGTLEVDAGATLAFDNRTSVCTLIVNNPDNPSSATLRILGAPENIAHLTISNTRGTQVVIDHGTIEAQYYLIEYLADNGIDIRPNATLHPSNNFSNGIFSNIRNVSGARYLTLEAGTYEGGEIENVAFNITGTPVAGIYNVQRMISNPPISFGGVITGDLAGYRFEKDELTETPAVPEDAIRGRLRWAPVSETKWIGVVSSEWDNDENWSDGIPTSSVDAIIPGGVPNDPILNVDAICRSLIISTGTLEMEGGFSLATSGDIIIGEGTGIGRLIVSDPDCDIICGGSWSRGINGQFIHGNGTVIFNTNNTSASISPLTSNFYNLVFNGNSSVFTLNGAVINILGNLEILSGSLNPGTSGYIINLGGDFYNQGTFMHGNGTVVLNGGSDQTITNGVFNHLLVSGSSTKYVTNATAIHGTTTISSTLRANDESTIDFRGNVLIGATGTFHDGDQTHTANGATWTGTGNYQGNGTIVFNRTNGNQTINASTFNNLEIACTGRILHLGGDVAVAGDMNVRAGVSGLYIMNHLITNTSGLGEFYAENSVLIRITGPDHFPRNFISYFMEPNTTVDYMGEIDQIVRGGLDVVYGNLILRNNSVKTLDGDIEIRSNLNFNNATLDVSPNNYTIIITGAWNNNNAAGGTFVPRMGEVIFNRSSGNQSISVHDNSVNPFYNLTVDMGTSSTLNAPGNKTLAIQNNLLVNNGRYSANSRTTEIGGDMYAVSGTFAQNGTFLLNKPAGEARIRTNYNYNSNSGQIRNITINSGANYTLESDFAAYGDFNLLSGTFNGNGHTVALGSSPTHNIIINGHYIFGNGGTMLCGQSSTINIGPDGIFEMIGTPDQNAVLTNNIHHGGRYAFVMNGLIKAEHYQFMYMNLNGIRITSSGLIDDTYNMSYGTFTHGQNNGTLLTIENFQTFVEPNYISHVNFPLSPGGTLAKNVNKTMDIGRIEFFEATGSFAGESFENDPFGRVDWTGLITLTWNGSINSDWNVADNWTASFGPSMVPTGNEDVIIANVMNSPRLTISGQKTKKLTINTGARLIIETDFDEGNTDLEILGDFEILGNGTLEISGLNDFITVVGSWSVPNSATLVNNGNVRFNGVGSIKTINNGNKSFYNLTIDGSTTYLAGNNITVINDFNILDGAVFDLSPGSFSMFVGGNWNNVGGFVRRNGTVNFTGLSGTRSINNGNSYFHHLTINAPATVYYLHSNDLRINGNFNLLAGTFNQNQLDVYMGDGVGSDQLNVSSGASYIVGANGTLRFGANAKANILSGGVFQAVGTSHANRATITNNGSGTYGFTVENSGVFAAQYYHFEYMDEFGFHLRPGAILNDINNLSNGIFSYGAPGGTYLMLENIMPSHPEDEEISNIVFNNGPAYNITRLTGSTVVNINDASGPMGSYAFENDAVMPPSPTTGLITWSLLNTYVWTGAIDNNWHNPANWLGGVPDETKIADIPVTGFDPEIFEGPASARIVSIGSGARLTVNQQNLAIEEDLWFAGNITAIGTPHITIGGNLTSASGTLNAGQSRIILNSPAGLITFNQPAGNFYDLEIAGNSTYNQLNDIRISNDLIISSGTLASNNRNIFVGGSWINSGGNYIAGNRTVFFNGDGNIIINPGSSSFYDLTINGSVNAVFGANTLVTRNYSQSAGSVNLNGFNLTINRRFTLSGGVFLAGSGNIQVRENWLISGSGVFTPNTSTVILTAPSGTRSITPRNQQFFNLTINGNALFNLVGAVVINNNLSILRGTLSVTTNNHSVTIGGNWLSNSVFSPHSGTVRFNGVNLQQLSGTSANHSFHNFIVENLSEEGLTLLRPVTITGHLALNNGIISNTTSSILTIANAATSSEGSDNSFVNGPVRKTGNQAFLFPIGKDNIYAPLHITAPNLTSNTFTAEYFFQANPHVNYECNNCAADIMNVSTTEYWDLTRNSGSATPDVTLFFRNMERSGIVDIEDLRLAHFNGTQWVSRGAGAVLDAPNMCHIVGTGFTSYSPLTAASHSGSNPLPVELLYFNASCNESSVFVQWATATEINNDYFTIEASADGINYQAVGFVDGAGNNNSMIEYSFTFTPDNSGLTYVRLRQTDFDGTFEYFGPVVVNCVETVDFEPEILVYPNPTRGLITVHGIEKNSRIVIYDQLMRMVKTVQSHESSVVLDISGNEPGVYFIQVHSNSKQFVRRVILQK